MASGLASCASRRRSSRRYEPERATYADARVGAGPRTGQAGSGWILSMIREPRERIECLRSRRSSTPRPAPCAGLEMLTSG